jgi:phenylpropionate dioxygenase-like ring-hydroxylating dioxygenase large terminal subunit
MSNSVARHMRVPPQFATGWFGVVRAQEVVGDRLVRLHFMGQELVAFRNARGAVTVLDATCPHFGAHLGHGGTVREGCVRCPFHGLVFDGDGQCVGGGLYAERGYRSVRTPPWSVDEAAGMVFVWHGPERDRPGWELPIRGLDWDGWSRPITNAGRPLPTTNLFFPTENIIDMTHFVNVHHWDLHRTLVPPHVNEAGHMRLRIGVTWSLGAQSANRWLRQLGSRISSPFEMDVVVLEPGLAVATIQLTEEQGSLQVRSVVMITPVSERDCHIRAAIAVKDPRHDGLASRLRTQLGFGLPEILSRLFLAVATKDFDGDATIWSHRRHLERPRPLKEDGPIVAYRRWSERFWPEDHERDAPQTVRRAAS